MDAIANLVFLLVALAAFALLRTLAWRLLVISSVAATQLPLKIAKSEPWKRSSALRLGFASRYPSAFRLLQRRFDPFEVTGLLFTLMVLAAFYLAALFSGLTEDILEAHGTILFDNSIQTLFRTWRAEPLISVFSWITALGSSPAAVAAVIIATGFLWAERRPWVLIPMWVTCFGAVISTSVGKFLIDRHRPPPELNIATITPSFPSGHATFALAVYGFLAYAIARELPNLRQRFEITYWTAVLIILIGFSRIFLGVHYVTDVIGGFLVGGFWLLVGFMVTEWNALRQTRSGEDRHER